MHAFSPLKLAADVFLCLVMHGLTAKEICQLSVCCKRLFEASRNPFAWRQCPPVRLEVQAAHPWAVPVCVLPMSPMNIVPLCIAWLPAGDVWLSPLDLDALLARLDTLVGHRVHGFDASLCSSMRHRLDRVFTHPSLARLQSVVLFHDTQRATISSELLRSFIEMPNLSSLVLWPASANPGCDWAQLGQLSSLTSLEIPDHVGEPQRLTAGVAACQRLRHLTIVLPQLYGSSFQDLFCRPNIAATLESLQLRRFHPLGDTGALTRSIRAAFIALTRLLRLHLSEMYAVDRLLLFVGLAPALRLIGLSAVSSSCYPQSSVIPSMPIEQLYAWAPRVHLRIRLQCPAGPLNRDSIAVIRDLEQRYAGRTLSFVSQPAKTAEPRQRTFCLKVFCGDEEMCAE